jgi:hypothetical protein
MVSLLTTYLTVAQKYSFSWKHSLVGFHDFFICFNYWPQCIGKTSSNDQHLLPFCQIYSAIEPEFANKITFVAGKLENFDAVIALEQQYCSLF